MKTKTKTITVSPKDKKTLEGILSTLKKVGTLDPECTVSYKTTLGGEPVCVYIKAKMVENIPLSPIKIESGSTSDLIQKKIKELCAALDVGIYRLARMLDISYMTIYKWSHGVTNPRTTNEDYIRLMSLTGDNITVLKTSVVASSKKN